MNMQFSLLPYFISSGTVILALIIPLWLVSLPLKNASIMDIFWGTGFVVIAWCTKFQLQEFFLPTSAYHATTAIYRGWLLLTLVTLWGLRLTLYILRRNWGQPEDFRYATWRQKQGPRWWWFSFFQVFLLQGFLIWIISMPIVAGQLPYFTFPGLFDLLGATVWLIGFIFEAVGDWQLVRFKADPANQGKLLTSGLWKFTRHPNYFGETFQWWGFWLIATAASAWWTVFSPMLLTWLLLQVSGVSMLEETMQARPGYERYMQYTSAFFPWFPKNKNH